MKIAQINMTYRGSTGKIMLQIADTARNEGNEVNTYAPIVFSRAEKVKPLIAPHHYTWGTQMESAFHYYAGSLTGRNGYFSGKGTRRLIRALKRFQPDIIHLHNLHGFCVNFPLLFQYIKKNKIRVVWTLHDCWTFTGHCPYFTMSGCDKWQTGCYGCDQYRRYPKSYVDDSKRMYQQKKKWFTGVENMMLVTPSQWLAELVRKSFMKDYPLQVVHNGVDLNIFQPTLSNVKMKYGIPNDTYIVLGVAFDWGKRKGLDVFVELSERLDSRKYQIVLVGTDDKTDKQLPKNIISIHRTDNQKELSQIYTAADVFVNPTREENYPTVNMEAIACATPVITFRTGGSPEIVDERCGTVVDCDDIDSLEREICRVCETKPYSEAMCLNRARAFDEKICFSKYLELYNLLYKDVK